MEKNITIQLSKDEARFILEKIGQGAKNISQLATADVISYILTRKIEKALEQPGDKFLG